MKVVAVDAGPAKGGTVFDGEFKSIAATDLPAYCQKLSQQEPVLLCWDAPLTGPPHPDGANDLASAYAQRIAERFFRSEQR